MGLFVTETIKTMLGKDWGMEDTGMLKLEGREQGPEVFPPWWHLELRVGGNLKTE